MKLKYYMRGLGIGIILTTLILSINSPKEKLTEAEIIARAEDLGMVMKEEDQGALDKVLASLKPSPTEAAADTDNPTEAETPTEAATPTQTATPTEAATPTQTATPTEAPAVTETPTQAAPEQTEDTDSTSEDDSEGQVTITVEDGMSAKQVSSLLQENGVIEDAKAFNDYVARVGKAELIRVGTYTFTKGTDYYAIVKTLTKGQ